MRDFEQDNRYDVVVVGGGTAGGIAAISAARTGARTLVVEKCGYLGGVLSLGMSLLGPADGEGYVSLGGVGRELMDRLRTIGGASEIIPESQGDSILPFDPELAKLVLLELAREADVNMLFHATLVNLRAERGNVSELLVATKGNVGTIRAKTVVDCTGDADVVARAGGRYSFGRPSDGLAQPVSRIFWLGGVNLVRTFDHLMTHPEDLYTGATPDAIAKLRAIPGVGFVGFGRLIEQARAAGDFTIPRNSVIVYTLPNRAVAGINVTRVHGVDGSDPYDVSRAEVETQIQILQALRFLRNYIPGFEEAYLISVPHQVGVRESRHIVGSYVLSREDVFEGRSFEDQIGRCSYPFDIHDVKPGESKAGEFDMNYARIMRSFGIPLRCLLPLDTANVAVGGRCISADHEAGSSIRGQAACMVTGQAAGTVAALGARLGCPLAEVPAIDVQKVLISQSALLERTERIGGTEA